MRQLAHPITWTDNLGGEVNIALYHNGVYSATIASNIASDGSYLWSPGAALAVGTGYTIRVISVTNPAVYDTSNTPFSLTEVHLLARDDFVIAAINTPESIYPLGNDESPPGASMTITAAGLPTHGTVSLVSDHLDYSPALDFLGSDVFTYTVNTSTEQATATVTVLVVSEVFHVWMPVIQR